MHTTAPASLRSRNAQPASRAARRLSCTAAGAARAVAAAALAAACGLWGASLAHAAPAVATVRAANAAPSAGGVALPAVLSPLEAQALDDRLGGAVVDLMVGCCGASTVDEALAVERDVRRVRGLAATAPVLVRGDDAALVQAVVDALASRSRLQAWAVRGDDTSTVAMPSTFEMSCERFLQGDDATAFAGFSRLADAGHAGGARMADWVLRLASPAAGLAAPGRARAVPAPRGTAPTPAWDAMLCDRG